MRISDNTHSTTPSLINFRNESNETNYVMIKQRQ
jgi:hypothetical protein